MAHTAPEGRSPCDHDARRMDVRCGAAQRSRSHDPWMADGTSHLVITRPGHYYRDAVRSYLLEVDGEDAGSIKAGETVILEVPAGSHKVRASIDWTGSPAVIVDARPGAQIRLLVGPAGSALSALLQIFKPMSYLKLSVQEETPPGPSTSTRPDPKQHDADDLEGPFQRR